MQCANKKCGAELVENAVFCHICGKKQTVTEKSTKKRGNGQGYVYKRGNTWSAQVTKYYITADDGRRKRKTITKAGFATKKDAIAHLPAMTKDEVKLPTLDDLWHVWESASLPKLSKDKQIAYKAAKRKMEDIFHTPVDILTIEDLQRIVDAKSTSYYTARDMKTVLSHLYKRAVAQRNVTVNLAQFVELPVLVEAEQTPFNKDEQNAFWKLFADGDEFVPYILLMIYTGMMPGELLNARKDMIDWDGRKIVGGGLKTKKRKQTPIVLPDIILPALEKICENKGEKLIHTSEDSFYKRYYACLERAGARSLKPYSCRHTTGTALGTADIPIAVVKEIMRHSKITTTQKYIHVDVDTMLEATNKAQGTPHLGELHSKSA